MVGWFNGMLLLCAKMFKTSWKEAKTPSDKRFGEPFNAPIIPSGALDKYSPTSARDQSRLHWLSKTVPPGICFGYAWIARRNRKGFLVAYKELESMDESERRQIHYPNRIWYSENVGKRPWFPKICSKTGTTCKEWRSQLRISRWTGRVSTDSISRLVDSSWLHISSPQWTSSSTLCANGRNIIPLKYIDVARASCTDLDVLHGRRIDDYWSIDSNRSLSDSWTGFPKFTQCLVSSHS